MNKWHSSLPRAYRSKYTDISAFEIQMITPKSVQPFVEENVVPAGDGSETITERAVSHTFKGALTPNNLHNM